jgi:formate hydrogenlyase subunit 6/NADH:ubiquinone oxidoreductase subunit I
MFGGKMVALKTDRVDHHEEDHHHEEHAVPKVKIYLMGKEYLVPKVLTIMAAIEYAGYKLVRGCGCRAGFCGACSTVYRKADDYKLYSALACQTLVEEGMYLAQIPFVPALKSKYAMEDLNSSDNVLLKHYPEIARCVSCNTCTRSCPQDIRVMDYVQAALRGNVARAAELSFDCIQCGLCSSRCPADIKHYHVAQMARRVYGRYVQDDSAQLALRNEELDTHAYDAEFVALKGMSLEGLKQRYEARTLETRDEED